MKCLHLSVVAAAVLLLGSGGLQASTISVTVVPSVGSVTAGQTLSAAIDIQGLQGSQSLGAFEFTLSWDSLILGSPVVTFGDPGLGDQLALTVPSITCIGTACGSASNFPLTIGEVSLDPVSVLNGSQADAFTLATVNFKALTSGSTSSLALSNIILADAYGSPLSAVPEPRTDMLILAAGLVGLLIQRRRASAQA